MVSCSTEHGVDAMPLTQHQDGLPQEPARPPSSQGKVGISQPANSALPSNMGDARGHQRRDYHGCYYLLERTN